MSIDPGRSHDGMLDDFIVAASVPRGGAHAGGTLDAAEVIRAAQPDITHRSVFAAAVLGDEAALRHALSADPEAATAAGGPFEWDPLTYLCVSRYLRLDRVRADGFLRSAELLLDGGASANTGWREHSPERSWESVLYGAAALARDVPLTRLLLDRGADPNVGEVPYHVPESYDNDVMRALLDSGRLTADSLSTMLLRKADWHDIDGMRLLLQCGADPDRMTQWGVTALEQAVRRDNDIAAVELLLDHGAHPRPANVRGGWAAVRFAAERGRGDVLRLFQARGVAIDLDGVNRLLVSCAMGNLDEARAQLAADLAMAQQFTAMRGAALAQFAGNGNVDGVQCLLALGVPVDAPYVSGDGYFGVAPGSTALHVASWRARHEAVRLLLERGADVNARDGAGRTALALAVRACVDSYWQQRRAPDSVALLLDAGASAHGIPVPTGYDAIDVLIRR